jgi:hypothetical protein
MQVPQTINVLQPNFKFGYFTALINGNTLGRNTMSLIKRDWTGELISFNSNSFFQNNNNVTKALYKVKGYKYPVVIWFDNETGSRIN